MGRLTKDVNSIRYFSRRLLECVVEEAVIAKEVGLSIIDQNALKEYFEKPNMIPDRRDLVIAGLEALRLLCLAAAELALEELQRVPDGE